MVTGGPALGGARAFRASRAAAVDRAGTHGDERPVVLVTGATGGVGRGIVEAFVEAGTDVVVHHRASPEAADALAARWPSDGDAAGVVGVVAADLTVAADRERLVAECEARAGLGGLDAVVLNAGVQPVAPLLDLRADDVRAMFETNVVAAFELTRLVAGPMAARGGGAIVAVASVEGHTPAVGHAHYAASKAALLMHARAAALELGPRGIRVNTVSPGLVDPGDLGERWPEGLASWTAAAPLGRAATPRDVGDACVYLASAGFVTGTDLVVDGGMSAVPAW